MEGDKKVDNDEKSADYDGQFGAFGSAVFRLNGYEQRRVTREFFFEDLPGN